MGFFVHDGLVFTPSLLAFVVKDGRMVIAAQVFRKSKNESKSESQISLSWELPLSAAPKMRSVDSVDSVGILSNTTTSTPWQAVSMGSSLLVVSVGGVAIGVSLV
jgi:hypothetical protein